MKTKIFNLIILDESGSMCTIQKQAVDGVNETLQTIAAAQKKYDNQEQFVTLVTFNGDAIHTLYQCMPIEQVEQLSYDQYQPNCATPLYDAMGQSLNGLRPKVAPDDRVLVTIVTDGEENASREYKGTAIRALVKELKDLGWVFVYIGANQDVEKVAGEMEIGNSLCFCASVAGMQEMNHRVDSRRERFYERVSRGLKDSVKENDSFFDDDF